MEPTTEDANTTSSYVVTTGDAEPLSATCFRPQNPKELCLSFPVPVPPRPNSVQGSEPIAPSVRDGHEPRPAALTLHGVRMPLVTRVADPDRGTRQHRR